MFGQELESSLLWKIEGNGIQPAYLYGTIHLLPQEDFNITEKVNSAFSESELIVMELDMDDPNMMTEMMQLAPMKNGETLDKYLSQEEFDALKSVLQEKQIPIEAVQGMKPFIVASYFYPDLIEGTPASFEGTFTQMAQQQEKEIRGLESVTEQMEVFEKVSYEEQAKDLMTMVNEQEEMKTLFASMVRIYKEEDINELYEITEEWMDTEEELEYMILERNRNWIERISSTSKEHKVFYAVGAAHLGGKGGVINLLKENNFKVTPITQGS
jgi:hypothetical protein